jgi:hypothetical protein
MTRHSENWQQRKANADRNFEIHNTQLQNQIARLELDRQRFAAQGEQDIADRIAKQIDDAEDQQKALTEMYFKIEQEAFDEENARAKAAEEVPKTKTPQQIQKSVENQVVQFQKDNPRPVAPLPAGGREALINALKARGLKVRGK